MSEIDQSSAGSLSNELLAFCDSKELSEEGLREIMEGHNVPIIFNGAGFFFVACRNKRVTEGIIRYLLKCFPDAARKVNPKNGLTPLHYACFNPNVTIYIIRLLIDAAPASVRSATFSNGDIPLQFLCANREVDEATAVEILKFLIKKYPEALRRVDGLGTLPIHRASLRKSPEYCRVLIEAYPGSEQIPSAEGSLPLHFACAKGSVATVEYLYKLYPDAIIRATPEGFYPIHRSILLVDRRDNPATAVEIVKYLLGCDPNVKLQKYKGMPLLHYALRMMKYDDDSNVEIGIKMIKIIIEAAPDSSVRSLDNFGSMPLQFLCRESKVDEAAAVQILKLLIEKYPEAVRIVDDEGDLPIHLAALHTTSPEFLRVLVEAYPGSVSMPDAMGKLPLHQACLGKGSLATVEYLYQQYPGAIYHPSTRRNYPIHAAIAGTKHRENVATAAEIVQFLLNRYPNQKLIQFEGMSLLHFACALKYNDSNIGAAIQVIKVVFDAHPEAIEDNKIMGDFQFQLYHQHVQAFIASQLVYALQAKDHSLMITPDDNGQLPLHREIQNNATLGSIKLLVKGNPSAIRNFDNNGAIPLHVACEHHNSANVVEYLVSLGDITLDTIDREGNAVLHYACRGAKYDTIALLLEKYDAVSVSKRNDHGKLPIDLLWESNAVDDRESPEHLETVFQLLRAYPEMVPISNLTLN